MVPSLSARVGSLTHPQERQVKISALVAFVTLAVLGVLPAGDDVTRPLAVAAHDFGCAFTNDPNGDHTLAAPCP